ncbi:MAG: NAD-dependent epimerase/dehydratase family protein [Zetaproteobacteria bacterium]|nr:MAG: NAD-dependent epimerase/dehydratase family protein [Zetaproteobacteria bacterium]
MGDVTVVTGGTGFVGGAVVRRLVAAGHRVRVLARPGNDRRLLVGLPVETVDGDLADAASLRRCLEGCGLLFHVAAMYSLWARDRRRFYEVNVEGTRRILQTAAERGVGRVVYTSTVGALGIRPDGGPGTEDTPVRLDDMIGDYKRSKFLAEEVAREFARTGLPVVIVNPSAPVGPGDVKPTPTGQMIVDFLRGKMWAYLDTGLNLVDVDDVAAGHLLAAERGRVGVRYILGGRNLDLREIFQTLGRLSGIRPPRIKAPAGAILPLARLSEWVSDRLTGRPPLVAVDAVRMARKRMFFDAGKAVRELGLPQTPVEDALGRAVAWFRAQGYAPAP